MFGFELRWKGVARVRQIGRASLAVLRWRNAHWGKFKATRAKINGLTIVLSFWGDSGCRLPPYIMQSFSLATFATSRKGWRCSSLVNFLDFALLLPIITGHWEFLENFCG